MTLGSGSVVGNFRTWFGARLQVGAFRVSIVCGSMVGSMVQAENIYMFPVYGFKEHIYLYGIDRWVGWSRFFARLLF